MWYSILLVMILYHILSRNGALLMKIHIKLIFLPDDGKKYFYAKKAGGFDAYVHVDNLKEGRIL